MVSSPMITNVTLSLENLSNQIFNLISSIRPDWNSSNTRLVTFTEGITNSIFGLFDARTPDDESQGLVIKLFGANTALFIDRPSEIDAMIKLSTNHVLSQHILIQFTNGFIYEFAPGKACSREDVRDEKISQLIAIKLAQFHNIPIEKMEQPFVFILLRKFLHLIKNKGNENISQFESDINRLEHEILPRLIPDIQLGRDLVLCHNDLLVKNIIYDHQTSIISFIDFEYTHVNYALFDIANHFVEYAGVDNADFSLYPTKDEQKRWLKMYFHTRNLNEQIIDDHLCQLIEQFSALAHLMWGLWALVQSQLSELDFDYGHYAKLRLDCYYKLRDKLLDNPSN